MTGKTEMLTADEVRKMLWKACAAAGGQTAWALAHDLAPNHVHVVIHGLKEPGPKITKALGLRRMWALDHEKR